MQKMIGFKVERKLTTENLQVTPKKFCKMLLKDFRHELMTELRQFDISSEQLGAMSARHKQAILKDEHKRRLIGNEKRAHNKLKTIVSGLSEQRDITHEIRVINYPEGSGMGAARITELFFDEEWWKNEFNSSESVFLFIMGHELTHIKFEDIAQDAALQELQSEIESKRAAHNFCEFKLRLNRLSELQADVDSAMHSKRALKGYALWTSQDIVECGDTGGAGYPRMSQRLHLAHLLRQLHDSYEPKIRKKRRIE